jgi:hypothetical protein
MDMTIFSEIRFWLLVLSSFVLPLGIYGILLAKRAISRATVLIFGFMLVVISGLDVYLLQSLKTSAKLSSALASNVFFSSEVSLALYLLPVMFGGIGVNIISHILVRHLVEAEKQFENEHSET